MKCLHQNLKYQMKFTNSMWDRGTLVPSGDDPACNRVSVIMYEGFWGGYLPNGSSSSLLHHTGTTIRRTRRLPRAPKRPKMQLCGSDSDERIPSKSVWTWWKWMEHTHAVYEKTEVLHYFMCAAEGLIFFLLITVSHTLGQEWSNLLARGPNLRLPGHWRPDTVRFTWQTAANAVALLSIAGNVVLGKNVQGIWRAGLNWSAGRSLAIPTLGELCRNLG